MKPSHFVSISGGKDSTACYLLALQRGVPFRAVMADTQHESPVTMEYVKSLPDLTGGPKVEMVRADFTAKIAAKAIFVRENWARHAVPQFAIDRAIEILKPTGNAYLDLCIWKGRFPSVRAQFCTEELKINPIHDQIISPARKAGQIVQWIGVRRDESTARSKAPRVQKLRNEGMHDAVTFRPIVHWTAKNVFEYTRLRGVPTNPLYTQGMSRVGCFPCIHAHKSELRAIQLRYPEVFEKLAGWEKLVADASKRGAATFFAGDTTPEGRAAVKRGEKGGRDGHQFPSALTVAQWARTGRGGKNYDLEKMIDEIDSHASCSSAYGLCE